MERRRQVILASTLEGAKDFEVKEGMVVVLGEFKTVDRGSHVCLLLSLLAVLRRTQASPL